MSYYRRDMLSIKTRNMLADYLADVVLLVDSVQVFRNALAEIQYFDGISLFRFIDANEKGYINVNDFKRIIGIDSKKILDYAFSWFDTSKVGEITRLQFVDYLFPREDNYLRELALVRMQNVVEISHLPPTMQVQIDIFKTLIKEIMKKQTKLISLRRQFMKQEDYSIKAVMNSLDLTNRGWILPLDLYNFMKNYDIDVSQNKIKELLGNYDYDMNGKITLNELLWIIQGLQNRIHPYREILKQSRKNKQPEPKHNIYYPLKQEPEKHKISIKKENLEQKPAKYPIKMQPPTEIRLKYPYEPDSHSKRQLNEKIYNYSFNNENSSAIYGTPLRKEDLYRNLDTGKKNFTKETRLWS